MLRTFLTRIIYFVCFIFVVAQAYENILTTKISRFTVYKTYTVDFTRGSICSQLFLTLLPCRETF